MRTALARAVVVLTAVGTAATACGSDQESAPSRPRSSAPPSLSSAESQAQFCADLNGFLTAVVAFNLGRIALHRDGETPEERANVSGSVDSMVRLSVLLLPEMPAHLADDLETVIVAANDAKVKLARGVPTLDAIDALRSEKVTTARDAVARYRGPC